MQRTSKPVVIPFLVLVFVLVVPFLVLAEIYPVELLPGLPISALGAFMPALAALILTFRQDGYSGVRVLLGRSLDFRRIKSPVWILLIVLTAPAIAVFAYGIMRLAGVLLPNRIPLTLSVIPLFVIFFIAALGEEIGWTGYVTEPLVKRWGTVIAGIVLGTVWATIHFIPLTQAHRSVEWIIWWSLGTISYRFIMTWLYAHSGRSLFGAAVFHAMINLSWQLFPNQGSYYDPRIFSLITFAFAVTIYGIEQFVLRYQSRFTNVQTRSSP